MPNKWVEWVRSYANRNGLSYACALSQPECKDSYRAKFGVAKKVPQKMERERMGLEDINIKPPPRRKPAQHSKEAFKMTAEDIRSRLMRENIPRQPLYNPHYDEPEPAPAPAPKRGRKPKYATDAERADAKRKQTLASNLFKTRERSKEKKEGKKMGIEDLRF